MSRLASLLLILLALAGCGRAIDGEQARICRLVLPALHPPGAAVEVLREAMTRGGPGIELAYKVTEPGEASRVQTVQCFFAGEGVAQNKRELTALAVNGRIFSDIKLHILKRWWIEAQPADTAVLATRPLITAPIAPAAAYLLQQVLNAWPLTIVYGLLAVSYTLLYGLVGRIYLAFGELAVVGGYGAVIALALAAMLGHGSVVVALPFGALAAGLLAAGVGGIAGRLVVAPLAHRPGQALLVASTGLAIATQEFLRIAQGSGDQWLTPVGGEPIRLAAAQGFMVTVTPLQAELTVAGLAVAVALVLALRASGFGRAWRAVADDARAAALCGVDIRGVVVESVVLAGLVAGIAGFILVANFGVISYSAGAALGLKALTAAVLGGIGSLPGALIGGVIVGMGETLWSAYLPIAYRDGVIYLALALMLALRPGGLFGFAKLTPRPV